MPAETTDIGAVRLGDVVRSSIWIIVATSLVGLLVGFALSTRLQPESTAVTPILLTPLDGNPFDPTSRGGQLVNLESEAQSVRSTQVAALAAAQLGTDATAEELLDAVSVEVPVNTQILEVAYTSADADEALAGSQAFAESYLEYRTQRAQARIDDQAALLDEQIAAANQELAAQATELAEQIEGSAGATVLQQRVETLADQVNTLEARRADLATTALDPGQVVTPAAVEGSGPLTPGRLLPLLGLVFGAVAGVLIGLARSRGDTRIRDPQDVLDLGLTVLGTIAWQDPTAASSTFDAARNDDDYRKLRVAVLALEKRRPFTLLVASASAGSTGPISVVDLCTSFARAGLDTVVVDATTAGNGPASILHPDSAAGLAEVLLGDEVLTEALAPVAPLLWVLGPGHEIDTVADLFVGTEMDRLLDATKDHCDVVIVATESLQQGVAQSLADVADAVLVEVDQDPTTRPELSRTARAIGVLSSTFLGTVFIGRDAAARTQRFRPHLPVHQRQLPAGPFAALEPVGDEPAPTAGEDPAEPSTVDAPSGAPSNGRNGRAEAAPPPPPPPARAPKRKAGPSQRSS